MSVEAWVAMMKMYFESQQEKSEKVLILPTFWHKQAQAWIMQKPEAERDSYWRAIRNESSHGGGIEGQVPRLPDDDFGES